MLALLLTTLIASAAPPLETVLISELERATAALASEEEPPYYIALAAEEREVWSIKATTGTIQSRQHREERVLDVDLRVGSPELDNTHELRGMSAWGAEDRGLVRLPIGEPPEHAIRHAIWRELDSSWRGASERIVMLRANQVVKVEEESPAPDFSLREPVVDRVPVDPITIDEAAWSEALTQVSARLDASPLTYSSAASLDGVHAIKTFVDTEGTRLVHGRNHVRVSLQVSTIAVDGDEVDVFDAWDVHDPSALPDLEALNARADELVQRMEALREAPRGQPWTGPVMLTGRASAVFFHEVFGHRVEGHRQKSAYEGKTFADFVGQPILPEWIDVVDDPTRSTWESTDLNGFYAYDDEGVPAQPANLVEDGVFKGFLMSRSPVPGFAESNGHGRRQAGRAPVARMGNTLVLSERTLPDEELRTQLKAEAKAQGLDYGILVEEIEGGFTMTGRVTPNAFNIRASASWRVYVDGRPDELIRGIDLVGTPFAAFNNLVATGTTYEVFNGHCGAESGWVPVSGVAPSMFFRRLEFQLKEKGQERPPMLAKPKAAPDDGTADLEVLP